MPVVETYQEHQPVMLRTLAYILMLFYCMNGLLAGVENHSWIGIATFVILGSLVTAFARPATD